MGDLEKWGSNSDQILNIMEKLKVTKNSFNKKAITICLHMRFMKGP